MDLCPSHCQARLQWFAYYLKLAVKTFAAGDRLPAVACEVCFVPLDSRGGLPSPRTTTPDGLERGSFCSPRCRDYANRSSEGIGLLGAPRVVWAAGNAIELSPHCTGFYADGKVRGECMLTAGQRGRVIRGTSLRMAPDEWLAWGVTSMLADGNGLSISMRGPVWSIDVEMAGKRFSGSYTG